MRPIKAAAKCTIHLVALLMMGVATEQAVAADTSAFGQPPNPSAGEVTLDSDTSENTDVIDRGLKIAGNEQQVVFSQRLQDLDQNERLRIRGELSISRCSQSDIAGDTDDPHNSCLGISSYNYNPDVEFKAVFAESQADTFGNRIGAGTTFVCTAGEHHCPGLIQGGADSTEIPIGTKWINFVVKAGPNGGNPDSDDLIDIEDGTGKFDVLRFGTGRLPSSDPSLSDEIDDLGSGNLVPIQTSTNPADPKVVYSQAIHGLTQGDVVDVYGQVRAVLGNYSYDPLITGKVLLVKQPDKIKTTDNSVEQVIAPQNGSNCTDHSTTGCTRKKIGAVRIKSGTPSTMYVAFVIGAIRNGVNGTANIEIKNGGESGITVWDRSND